MQNRINCGKIQPSAKSINCQSFNSKDRRKIPPAFLIPSHKVIVKSRIQPNTWTKRQPRGGTVLASHFPLINGGRVPFGGKICLATGKRGLEKRTREEEPSFDPFFSDLIGVCVCEKAKTGRTKLSRWGGRISAN